MRLPTPIGPCHPCPLPTARLPCPASGDRPSPPTPPRRPTPSCSAKAGTSKKACTSSVPSRFRNSAAPTNAFQPHRQTPGQQPRGRPYRDSLQAIGATSPAAFVSLISHPRAHSARFQPLLRLGVQPSLIRQSVTSPKGDSTSELPIVLSQLLRHQRRKLPGKRRADPRDRPPVPEGLPLLHDRRPLTTAPCTEYQPCCRGTGGNPPRSPALLLPAACRPPGPPQRSRRRPFGPRPSTTSARRPRAY